MLAVSYVLAVSEKSKRFLSEIFIFSFRTVVVVSEDLAASKPFYGFIGAGMGNKKLVPLNLKGLMVASNMVSKFYWEVVSTKFLILSLLDPSHLR